MRLHLNDQWKGPYQNRVLSESHLPKLKHFFLKKKKLELAGIQQDVFDTTWRPTSLTVNVKGGKVDGIHRTSLAIRYVVENQGVSGEGWKVDADDLKKVRCALECMIF